MTPADRPFDPGLQPERTSLAWQRTALALAIAMILGARLVAHLGGGWAPVLAAAGIAAIAALLAVGHRRYRRVHEALTGGRPSALPGGGGLVFWVAGASGLGLVAAAAVVLLVVSR